MEGAIDEKSQQCNELPDISLQWVSRRRAVDTNFGPAPSLK